MQNFNFNDSGNDAKSTFFYALQLLQAITPDEEQQQNGITPKK
jgi:hypothetical protein